MFEPRIGPVIVMAGLLALGVAAVAPAETNINFLLGGKLLDSEDWSPGEGQGEVGVMTSFGSQSWPVKIAIDVLGSAATQESFRVVTPGVDLRGEKLTQSTLELDVGVRKIWQQGKARPFVGGGIAVIWAQQERLPRFLVVDPEAPFEQIPFPPGVLVFSDDDQGVGGWIDGGIFWRLGKHFNIGMEARLSAAEVNLLGRDVDAGGFHYGLILGFGF